MTKYFLMARKIPENGTIIRKSSHRFTELKTGRFLPETFKNPLECQLLGDYADGVMPTFYMSPAVIGTQQFYDDLLYSGVDNIETKPVIIKDLVNNRIIEDYLLLNFIGRVSCADMEKSEYNDLGDDMKVINKLVIDPDKITDFNLCLLDEDTDCIIISEQVYNHLNAKGYDDIHFEALARSD